VNTKTPLIFRYINIVNIAPNTMSVLHKIKNDCFPEKCPLCGHKNVESQGFIKYSIPTFFSTSIVELEYNPELYKCLECDSGFSVNIICEAEAKALYQKGESNDRWNSNLFEVEKPKEVVAAITPLLTPGSKVLDIGCAGGRFLDFAKKNQCLTYGLEYSQSNIELLKSNGHTAHSSEEELTEKYDLITAFDVVEHLYNVNKFIDFCLEHLSPSGHLVIVTGDISSTSAKISKNNWWYVSYPEHIIFPSVKYFQSHSKLRDIQLVHTFASLKRKKYTLRFRSMVKFLLPGRFSGNFIGCDHILMIIKPQH
jgi:2-polyprenyl-3-methyl-5-hydroxy-6-metoxy-1,4-benzoquinol methylase